MSLRPLAREGGRGARGGVSASTRSLSQSRTKPSPAVCPWAMLLELSLGRPVLVLTHQSVFKLDQFLCPPSGGRDRGPGPSPCLPRGRGEESPPKSL